MKTPPRKLGIISATVAVAMLSAVVLVHPIGAASSRQPSVTDHPMPGHGQIPEMTQQQHQMKQLQSSGPAQVAMTTPTMPGQDAFGAVQEIVRILEANPKTDWSKVDLEALRQHLIDMNEVTLNADAAARQIDGGLAIAVTGSGRTLAAIQRMITAHSREIDAVNGWSAATQALPNGVLLTVTSSDPKEIAHIRGLGFIGLLVSGSHHQPHHLAMANGEFAHAH